jgi:hypothetical protein
MMFQRFGKIYDTCIVILQKNSYKHTSLQVAVFQIKTLCSDVVGYQDFEEPCCLHLWAEVNGSWGTIGTGREPVPICQCYPFLYMLKWNAPVHHLAPLLTISGLLKVSLSKPVHICEDWILCLTFSTCSGLAWYATSFFTDH